MQRNAAFSLLVYLLFQSFLPILLVRERLRYGLQPGTRIQTRGRGEGRAGGGGVRRGYEGRGADAHHRRGVEKLISVLFCYKIGLPNLRSAYTLRRCFCGCF